MIPHPITYACVFVIPSVSDIVHRTPRRFKPLKCRAYWSALRVTDVVLPRFATPKTTRCVTDEVDWGSIDLLCSWRGGADSPGFVFAPACQATRLYARRNTRPLTHLHVHQSDATACQISQSRAVNLTMQAPFFGRFFARNGAPAWQRNEAGEGARLTSTECTSGPLPSCLSQHLGIFRASCQQNRQSDLVIRLRMVDPIAAGTML